MDARLRFVGLSLLATALTASHTRAQLPCLEAPTTVYSGTYAGALFAYDHDTDGDVDLAYGWTIVKRMSNDGSGLFTSASPDIVTVASSNGLAHTFVDVDGDALPDYLFVDPTGQKLVVVLHTAFTTSPAGTSYPTQAGPSGLVVGDLDGDGDQDVIVTNQVANSFTPFFNDGSGSFTPTGPQIHYTTSAGPIEPVLADFDADGKLDLAHLSVGAGVVTIQHGNGAGGFTSTLTLPTGPDVTALTAADLNGDARPDLVISYGNLYDNNFNSIPEFRVRLQQAGGAFGAPTAFPIGCQGLDVVLADVDGDGDLDALAAGHCTSVFYVALGNGNGTFGAPTVLVSTLLPAADVKIADVDRDGDPDVIVSSGQIVSSLNQGRIEVFRNCNRAGAPYCSGDGSATACPCGNASAPGANTGCLSSVATGGSLRANGAARLSNDTVVLSGTQMPATSTVLYFQGNARANGGAGNALGDGLQCASGTIVRLGVRLNSGGASTYPTGGSPSLHVQGGVAVPGERFYQAWYRDSANFCTASSFNLSNALSIRWFP